MQGPAVTRHLFDGPLFSVSLNLPFFNRLVLHLIELDHFQVIWRNEKEKKQEQIKQKRLQLVHFSQARCKLTRSGITVRCVVNAPTHLRRVNEGQ